MNHRRNQENGAFRFPWTVRFVIDLKRSSNFLEWYSNHRTDYKIKRYHIIEYFCPNKIEYKLLRDKAWLKKLKPAMQLEDSSLILVWMAHCKGLVKGLREDYVVEKI